MMSLLRVRVDPLGESVVRTVASWATAAAAATLPSAAAAPLPAPTPPPPPPTDPPGWS